MDFNTPPNETPNTVQIWHRKQGYWLASGTSVPVNPVSDGIVNARALNVTQFSPFGISRISLPLPIKLIDFSAEKIADNLASINWELAACCSKDAKFELEKSTDNRNFSLLSVITGSESSRYYSFNDSRLKKGITWYRLKMIDADGSIKYSKVVAIVNDEKGFLITAIAPNPVQDAATITLTSARKTVVQFNVYDVSGNMVKQWYSNITKGINSINMNVMELARGTYFIVASTLDTRATYRFVKQ